MDSILDQWEARRRAGKLYDDLDAEFHRILYAELGNETLIKLLDVFWTIYTSRDRQSVPQADPDEIFRLHREIVAALRGREPGEVRRLLSLTLELGMAALRASESEMSQQVV
jgi:DNA-binding GntR family transcriptional regulator